jgi:hypothetical protein
MLRPFLFAFGWVFFALGVIGAFLPILPTTPFLLLAALCFSKSSPRFHRWLLEMPVFGAAVKDWQERRVIRTRAKLLCASMLLVSLAIIWTRPTPSLYIKLPVTLIIVSVGTFVVTRKAS